MRSPFPTRRRDRAAALIAAALVLAGCGDDVDPPMPVAAAPDRVVAGPQGVHGQFVVECAFDRFLPDDPIVYPDRPGASHLHQFFGAIGVDATSSLDDLVDGATTCQQQGDTASYWAPALIGGDHQPIEPERVVAYYRAGPDVDPAAVVPYPPGLMMVAGDHTATAPQPLSVVAWACGSGSERSEYPLDCTGASSLRMVVTFPDCWDGEHARSPIVPRPDLHVAYSADGRCPEDHPVHVPQLQLAVDYPPVPPTELDDLGLASGPIVSGHADFWNGWDPAKLRNEVAHCLHRDLTCGVSG